MTNRNIWEKSSKFDHLLRETRACTLCSGVLPHSPRPIFSLDNQSKILIIGQAPGKKAHDGGIPFDDNSGDRLRQWMGVSSDTFYNATKIGILPIGLCFPGYVNGADAPPVKECAPKWHTLLLQHIKPKFTIYVGRYAQQYYLPQFKTLTEAIKHSTPTYWVLPHPSGRNNRWLAKHPWFEQDVLPELRRRVASTLALDKN